jgi:hypothetical protein
VEFSAGIWMGRKEIIEGGERLLAMAKIEYFECIVGEQMRAMEMSCCMVVITFDRLRRIF